MIGGAPNQNKLETKHNKKQQKTNKQRKLFHSQQCIVQACRPATRDRQRPAGVVVVLFCNRGIRSSSGSATMKGGFQQSNRPVARPVYQGPGSAGTLPQQQKKKHAEWCRENASLRKLSSNLQRDAQGFFATRSDLQQVYTSTKSCNTSQTITMYFVFLEGIALYVQRRRTAIKLSLVITLLPPTAKAPAPCGGAASVVLQLAANLPCCIFYSCRTKFKQDEDLRVQTGLIWSGRSILHLC